MVNKKKEAHFLFLSIWDSGRKSIDLDKLALEIIKNNNSSLSYLERNEFWKKIRPLVIIQLEKKIQNCYDKKITPNYQFIDYTSPDKLMRSDMFYQEGTEERSKIEITIFYRRNIIKALYSINWKNFEIFCAYLLHLYGFKNVNYTQHYRDGGH